MLLHSSKGQTLIHHTLPTTGRELPSGSTVTPQPAAGLGSWFLPQVHMGAAEATHNLRPGPTQRQNKKQSGEQHTVTFSTLEKWLLFQTSFLLISRSPVMVRCPLPFGALFRWTRSIMHPQSEVLHQVGKLHVKCEIVYPRTVSVDKWF